MINCMLSDPVRLYRTVTDYYKPNNTEEQQPPTGLTITYDKEERLQIYDKLRRDDEITENKRTPKKARISDTTPQHGEIYMEETIRNEHKE